MHTQRDDEQGSIVLYIQPAGVIYVATVGYVLYAVLCGVAMWSTFQDSWSSRKRMRAPLVAMFIVLTVSLTVTAIQTQLPPEYLSWDSAFKHDVLRIVSNVTTCLAGVLSDGLLAWRCFVLFGKRPWMKWTLTALITVDFGVGALANIALGTQLNVDYDRAYHPITQYDDDTTHLGTDNDRFQIFVDIWALLFFVINSTMTTSVIYKIFSSAYRVKVATRPCKDHYVYKTVIRAVIESSLVAWTGLLAYAITNTYSLVHKADPNSPDDVAAQTHTFAFTALPFIFGISQSLIIARIGLSRLRAPSPAAQRTALVLAVDPEEKQERFQVELHLTGGGEDIELGAKHSLSHTSST